MKYKKWTLDQKLEILSASEDIGIVEACRKYRVSTGTSVGRRSLSKRERQA